jgi:hypothetical protein
MDELYKGSVLADKSGLVKFDTYRRLNFFQFPKES